jgi:hypothetical protein
MRAGDMEMPGGMKINMVDAANGHPTISGAGGSLDPAKIREEAMSGHMNSADIAKLRAQAEAMKKQMKGAEQP